MHIPAAVAVNENLLPAMRELERELSLKSTEFHDVIKIGRTHLQDAVPMRLGQEFAGYAQQIRNAITRLTPAVEGLYELPLGGTAVGTGLNAPAGFAGETIAEISHMV